MYLSCLARSAVGDTLVYTVLHSFFKHLEHLRLGSNSMVMFFFNFYSLLVSIRDVLIFLICETLH